jgi:hypothetical protein
VADANFNKDCRHCLHCDDSGVSAGEQTSPQRKQGPSVQKAAILEQLFDLQALIQWSGYSLVRPLLALRVSFG